MIRCHINGNGYLIIWTTETHFALVSIQCDYGRQCLQMVSELAEQNIPNIPGPHRFQCDDDGDDDATFDQPDTALIALPYPPESNRHPLLTPRTNNATLNLAIVLASNNYNVRQVFCFKRKVESG